VRKLTVYSFIFSLSGSVFASDFNIPFVNSSGLGVGYADWATAASDASTAYTNPAGLVHLPGKQFVFNALGIVGTAEYKGTSTTPAFPFPITIQQTGKAKSQIKAFLPSFYYSAALSEDFAFGVHFTAPFGLGTDYGSSSIVRYASKRARVVALDIGPSLAYKLSDVASIGAGLDAVNLSFKLNNMYGPPFSIFADSELENELSGWGYGWHAGLLFDLTPKTRLGLSYNSKLSIRTTGFSAVYLPGGGRLYTGTQVSKGALPARAQLSLQHDLTERWRVMSTLFYVNWKSFDKIALESTMTPSGFTTRVIIPFNYHNCFDYTVGTSYQVNEKWVLRGGAQFTCTPSNSIDRIVGDPIGSATIVTLGAGYHATKKLRLDLGVGHSFFEKMPINYNNGLTMLRGRTKAQTTVVGGQATWSIA